MLGAISIEREMAAVLVVVGDVACDQPASVGFVQDDDMVEQLSPEAADPPLCDPVLPWSSE